MDPHNNVRQKHSPVFISCPHYFNKIILEGIVGHHSVVDSAILQHHPMDFSLPFCRFDTQPILFLIWCSNTATNSQSDPSYKSYYRFSLEMATSSEIDFTLACEMFEIDKNSRNMAVGNACVIAFHAICTYWRDYM